MKRGEIYFIDIPKDENDKHKQWGYRPCVIISNDMNNKYCSRVQYIPMTSQQGKTKLPTHITLKSTRMQKDTIALCECIDAIDKSYVKEKVGRVSEEDLIGIEMGMLIQLYPQNKLSFMINNLRQVSYA